MRGKPDTSTRIALVEDHPATREELASLLAELQAVELVGTHPSADAFFQSLDPLSIDVVLMDLMLPGMSGIDAIRKLAAQAPRVRAVALTSCDDEPTVIDAIRAGAFGYLLKDEPKARLLAAIEEAARGATPVSSRIAGFLLTHARRSPPPVSLSEREEELAGALADGLTYVECTARMGVSLGTVQEYVKRLYRKLEVNSRSEVKAWVRRHLR